MAEEIKQESLESELAKARKKVDRANKWRLAFLFIALVILVFLFWGEKMWAEAVWFETLRSKAYIVALVDLLGLLIATFSKLFCVVKYNRIVKMKR